MRSFNRSTTPLDAARVGCTMDGIATDDYCFARGFEGVEFKNKEETSQRG
jgi:hypothetical protein